MERSESAERVDLRRTLQLALRNGWIVAVLVVIGAGGAYVRAEAKTKIYSASAVVRVFDPNDSSATAASANARVDPLREVQLQVLYARSTQVTDEVDRRMGTQARKVRAHTVTGSLDSDTITIAVQSPDRTVAALAASTYVQVYVAQRHAEIAQRYTVQEIPLQTALATNTAEIKSVDTLIASLQPALPFVTINGVTQPVPESEQLRNLDTQRSALVGQQVALGSQISDLEGASAVSRSDLDVVQSPTRPTSPIIPLPHRDAAVGGAIGLLIGLGVVALRLRLRDKVTTSADVAAVMPALAFVAPLPPRWSSIVEQRLRRSPRFDAVDGRASLRDAYRALRASVLYGDPKNGRGSLLVTSANGGEGKTTIATNLAVSLARGGAKVVVVDCDLRRPALHEQFDIAGEVGFASALTAATPVAGAVCTVDVAGTSIDVLPAGHSTADPGDLLVRPVVTEVIDTLKGTYDYVVLDGPSGLPAAEALALARVADRVLVVVKSGHTKANALRQLDVLLRRVSAHVVGAVLFGVRADRQPATGPGSAGASRWRLVAVADGDADQNGGPGDGSSAEKSNVLIL